MSMNSATENFLAGLKSHEFLLKLTWDEWLAIEAPYSATQLTTADAWTRYQRNGYDWDMHGTLYTPEKETDSRRAFVFFHGGAGSEKIMDLTPDGRPGIGARARVRRDLKCWRLPIRAITRSAAYGNNHRRAKCRSISRIAICRQAKF